MCVYSEDLDFARKEISKLSQQNDLLQQQLNASDHSPQDNHQDHPHLPNGVVDHSKQVEELLERIKGLQEQNQLLERAVKAKDHPSGHQKHLGIATVGSGGLIKKNGREKGGSSPNLNSLSGLHDNSAKQIHQMASRVSQKLSLSANSLESDNPAHLSQLCSQLKEQLAEADRLSRDTHKENLHLTNQMQAMTNKMDEMNCEIDSLQNQVGMVLEGVCGPRGWVWSWRVSVVLLGVCGPRGWVWSWRVSVVLLGGCGPGGWVWSYWVGGYSL